MYVVLGGYDIITVTSHDNFKSLATGIFLQGLVRNQANIKAPNNWSFVGLDKEPIRWKALSCHDVIIILAWNNGSFHWFSRPWRHTKMMSRSLIIVILNPMCVPTVANFITDSAWRNAIMSIASRRIRMSALLLLGYSITARSMRYIKSLRLSLRMRCLVYHGTSSFHFHEKHGYLLFQNRPSPSGIG